MLAQNLDDVLSFVAETLRKDEKQVFRLADYANGIVYHEAELHGIDGLELNVNERNGAVAWLKVARLTKEPPPKFPLSDGTAVSITSDIIASDRWVTVPDDPNGTPTLKGSIRLLLLQSHARSLMTSGKIERSDYGEPNATGRVMTTLYAERFPEVAQLYERWLQLGWLPWAERERPRRRSIAFYDEMFKLHAAITGRDAALEVVIGVGQLRGPIADHDVDHPLIEYRAEISVDPRSATITIASKDDACALFAFPAEDGTGAAALTSAARRHWADVPDSCDISPFERLHWEPVLQTAASFLGSSGVYTTLAAPRHLPSVSTGFAIFDNWVLFVRPSSLRPMLDDISAMQDELRKAESLDPLIALLNDPLSADGLVQGMIDRVADLIRSASTFVNVHGNGAAGGTQMPVTVAPYFPKLSNQDQEKIIRILERMESKGLVVQGPPGTGKSHSIANILCHGLASGWRILVAAHSDGPLQVLKGMLPRELRNLAINLSSSEQSEVSQLEESVKAIAAIATKVDDQNAHIRRIENVEQRILSNKVRLIEINEAFLSWARENLEYQEAYNGRVTAASLAEAIVTQSEANQWFDDVIPLDNIVPPMGEPEIGRLRALRAKLRDDLRSYEWRLPEDQKLPVEDDIVRIHTALAEGKALNRFVAGITIHHLAGVTDGRNEAINLRQRIAQIKEALKAFRDCSWLSPWFEDSILPPDDQRLAPAALEVIDVMAALVAKESDFVKNQVVVPSLPEGMGIAVSKAANSDKPYSKLPFIRPTPEVMKALDAVRVRGQIPKGKDWILVGEYIEWLDAIGVAAARWNALADLYALERCPSSARDALSWFKAAIGSLRTAQRLNDALLPDLRARTLLLSTVSLDRSAIRTRRAELDATDAILDSWSESIRHRISQLDVAWAIARHREIVGLLESYSAPAVNDLRLMVSALGDERLNESQIGEGWHKAVANVATARSLAAMGRELAAAADKLAAAGAEKWAHRIKSIPAVDGSGMLANTDSIIPAEWRAAWEWSAWKGKLEGVRSLAKIKRLLSEQASLNKEIAKLMSDVVVLRTELQLSRLPKRLLTKLTLFQNAVQRTGAGTGVRAARLRKEAKRLASECYDAVPCWIMPIKKVAETQPSKLGIFDLVIIDEASQCGPEAIPVMMRAKKALIVGDDKQVSPTSFMSEDSYLQLQARFLADSPYRSALSPGASMYDLASAMFAGHNIRLREHFRCVEPIIRFSMRFYGQDPSSGLIPLRIPMPSERLDPPVVDIYVPHGIAHGKTNLAEATVIATQIEEIANDPRYAGKTVGVISLNGVEQANLIEREIINRLGTEIFAKLELLVADSSGFQGKERSIMFLSMVDAPNRRTMARVQDVYAQRYNVALSRARDRMYLVHSVRLADLNNPRDMRRLALEHFADPMPTEVARRQATDDVMARCDSGFERDVLSRLIRDGYDATPQFPAGGYKIDIVVDGDDDRRLAIELDGDSYHPPEQYGRDMERQQQLERVGFKFWRCWWSEWILSPDNCYSDLISALDALEIKPLMGAHRPRSVYAASFVADEAGKLYTPEDYARQAFEQSNNASERAQYEYVDAEFSEVAGDRGQGQAAGSRRPTEANVLALSPPPNRSKALKPGDMIVVQIARLATDECRTRNLEIWSGAEDRLSTGKISASGKLGAILCAASVDDTFELEIDGEALAITVIGMRRAA